MSLTGREQHLLEAIGAGLARSDPGLERLMRIFGQLTADEQMPAREQVRRRWPRAVAGRRGRSRNSPGSRARTGAGAVVIMVWILACAVMISLAVALSHGHGGCPDVSVAGCLSGHPRGLPEPGRVGHNGGPAMRLAVQAQAPALLMASTTLSVLRTPGRGVGVMESGTAPAGADPAGNLAPGGRRAAAGAAR